MKQTIIGARTSSDDSEHDSIETQLEECRAFAKAQGYTVIAETREESVSGGLPTEQRLELQHGLDLLQSGRAEAYIWRSPDRLGRRADTGQLIIDHKVFGAGIFFVRTPQIEDPVAESLLRGSFTSFAEAERKMIYQRTSAGRNRSAADGRGVGIGTLPRWLRWTGKEFELIEREAERVRRVVLGTFKEASTRGDPHDLTRYRHQPTVGGLRVVLPLRSSSPEALYRKQEKTKRRRERREGILRVMACPTIEEAEQTAKDLGLITQRVPSPVTWKEFYEAYQQALRTPNVRRGRTPKVRLPLQGRVFCAQHGRAFTPRTSNGGAGYVYATCTARLGWVAEKEGGKCEAPRLPWDRDTRRGRSLTGLVFDALAKTLRSPEGLRQAAEDHIVALRARTDQLVMATGDLETEKDRLKERKARLGILWADGDLPDERWRKEKVRLDRQLVELEGRTVGVVSGLRSLDEVRVQLEMAEELLSSGRLQTLVGYFAIIRDGEPENLTELAERLNLKVYVEHDRLRLEAAVPLDAVTLGETTSAVPSRRTINLVSLHLTVTASLGRRAA